VTTAGRPQNIDSISASASLGARNQNMDMMIHPDLDEITFIPTQRDAIFQPKVSDRVL
jgi:hypothetical protein